MDRPDYFSVISDPDDPVERMAAVVRWYLSKDLKFVVSSTRRPAHHLPIEKSVKDKLVKAYNSTLGEQFLAEYNTQPATPPFSGTPVAESAGGPTRKVAMMIEQISHHPPISAFCYECQEKGIVARGLDQIAAKFTGTGANPDLIFAPSRCPHRRSGA
ncbi:MAG: hypothetical protein BJ554DRAFT_2393 [Olpidium bornovanus]|uniref:Oxysterol-binding protein n=1 Tax=Olpidium bornovanus TaxID=278681 RepID=A0A8H8DGB7_9FUNG|nr:MAG: hypothetical protein BJ554DRAFT_2393 [Olpidium bornovanus]